MSAPLPQTHFYSVEYPGYIKPASVDYAIRTLGGQAAIESAFKRTANKAESLLELNFRPDNPFSHPVPGEVVATNNLLVKVVKRKRRKLGQDGTVGAYTIEALGVITKTVRFRGE
jgi:general transcription factor 3C polypeptide 5 (transcription factor C subunit 1)